MAGISSSVLMGSELLTSTSRALATADLSVVTAGHTATLDSLSIGPVVGPSRLLRVACTIDGTTQIEVVLMLRDESFEEFDLYGGRKGVGSREGEASGTYY